MCIDILMLISMIALNREVWMVKLKGGTHLLTLKKAWVAVVLFMITDTMAFASLFVPLFQCHFNNYMMSMNRTESFILFINTAFILSSGYFINVFFCSLYLHQANISMLSLMMACLFGISFIVGHLNEIQTSNVAFNTNCYRTSTLALEASQDLCLRWVCSCFWRTRGG